VWDGVPVQRCTVHKHRNLLAHAPSGCMRRLAPTTTDMIYAAPQRNRMLAARLHPKWGLQAPCRGRQPREAGERLFHLHPPAAKPVAQAHGRRMRSSGCTRSSNEGLRPRPYCRLPNCRHAVLGVARFRSESTCARSMAGRRSPPSPSISRLTSQLETILHVTGLRHTHFQPRSRRYPSANQISIVSMPTAFSRAIGPGARV